MSGTVSDNTGEPIMGATILIEETTTGTVTDFDGNFTLEVPENATLQISYIGYKTTQVNTQGKNTFTIVLEENSELLGDVIVIGYGRIKKEDATGAVLAIKPDEMNKGSQVTAQDALIGKIPGVSIIPG
ncbi:MAG: carboxypeptidase-like regulatory domain-containing protein [Tannerellaceae bacterium]|nr:carboxypeptidase-like regulatory domain-containing protein [Tannerellaceae bacterium]